MAVGFALWAVLLFAGLVSSDVPGVAAQPCKECGDASLVINGDVLTPDGVRSSQRRNTVAFVNVNMLAEAVNGKGAGLEPLLRLDGAERPALAADGLCETCRFYTTGEGGCATCPIRVTGKDLISAQIYWADGWYVPLPDLATALGGTLTWNDDQTVYTITVPKEGCPTCLLTYKGSSGPSPGIPQTGAPEVSWLPLLAAIGALVASVGLVLRRATPR
jgi:hypothetical protein